MAQSIRSSCGRLLNVFCILLAQFLMIKYQIYSKQVRFLVDSMMKLAMNENDIGVITPYSMQVRIIEFGLSQYPNLKVGTVEDFQGLERKVILISTVRTCRGGMKVDVSRLLGFVKCPKRINVALSRAR